MTKNVSEKLRSMRGSPLATITTGASAAMDRTAICRSSTVPGKPCRYYEERGSGRRLSAVSRQSLEHAAEFGQGLADRRMSGANGLDLSQ